MPDTGAPWNIPYVAPTDNPRVYPAADEAAALAIAAGLTAAGNEGTGPNVVQAIKTNTFTTTSSSFVDITDLEATITPSTGTAKVLVIVQLTYGVPNGSGIGHFKVVGGNTSVYVGGADGSRVSAVFGGGSPANLSDATFSGGIVFLDAPLSSSPTTYKVQCRQANVGTVFINRSSADANSAATTRGASSITVIEVEA